MERLYPAHITTENLEKYEYSSDSFGAVMEKVHELRESLECSSTGFVVNNRTSAVCFSYNDSYNLANVDEDEWDDGEDDWEGDADECGFNPYMGCYDFDC